MLVIPNWLLFVNQTAGVLQHTVTLNIGLEFLQQLGWESYTISFVILHCLAVIVHVSCAQMRVLREIRSRE